MDTGSLFILSSTAEKIFSFAPGLTFELKDYNGISTNDAVGQLVVPQKELLAMTGQRVKYELQIMPAFQRQTTHFHPKLQLRVLKATPTDVLFMEQWNAPKANKKLGIYADRSFVSPAVERVKLLKRETKKVDGIQLVRR